MINLMRRDLILQKNLLWLYVPFILFFVIMWSSPFLIFTLAALYIPFNAFAYDEKVESDKLLNSLPYTRLEIITSRYISAILYTIVSIVLVSGLLLLFNKPFGISDILIGSSLFLLLAAFTFPLFQIFKQGNITSIILLVFIVGTVLLSNSSELINTYGPTLSNNDGVLSWLVPLVLMMTVLIIYTLSWLTTYTIYNKKDF